MVAQRVLNDRYRLLVKVGEGGMAEVYRAQDMLLGRAVAVKLLRPQYNTESSFLVRFLQEAQAAAGLSHPNIVAVYDIGQDGDQRYIVMEYVEGVNLKDIILESAPFSVDRAVDFALQISRAVGVAHRMGLVHRDVKPQNVIVMAGNLVKVTDFGIARALSAPKGITEEGTVWGTPHYISPEQASGEEVGPPADVYSIGIVLFEMLTGRLPFDGPSSVAIAMKHVREMPPSVSRLNPAVPPELAAIVAKALAKSPEDRYPSATEFAQVLRAYQRASERGAVVPAPAPVPLPVRPRPTYLPEPVVSRPIEPPEEFVEVEPEAEPELESTPRQGIDLLTIVIIAVVFIVMIALIPVGIFVYQTYAEKPPLPTPSPTPTVIILRDDVRVPELTGISQDEARDRARNAGLRVEVSEERYSSTVPQGLVMEQERPPGQMARRGDLVRILVSKGPEPVNVKLPRFIGQEVAEAEKQLLEKGLAATTSEQWGGPVTAGVVLQQEPAEGVEVPPGATVKLTVSTGPNFKVKAIIDQNTMLMACDLERDVYWTGETLPVTLYWTASAPIKRDFNVFVHLTRDGQIVAQQDNPPVKGARPTSGWVTGEAIKDAYALVIPSGAAPGTYWLEVGMYTPQNNQRLPVTNPGSVHTANQALLVRQIQVQSR